jgi:hypothetical protein
MGGKEKKRRGIAGSHHKCETDRKYGISDKGKKQREEKPTRREKQPRKAALGQRLPMHAEAFD